ncbi:DNA repair protein xrcc2 [Coemansia sp. 'formosensis']|nr:DNA repair protein xrcc2 [Coemansia sp. 'formosensis']
MPTELDRLLSQIKTDTARNVAGLAPPPPKHAALYTGVEAMDDALREIYAASENSTAPLLELLGLPGSGKTQTAYHITAHAALQGHSVLFIDIDGKASPHALARYIGEEEALRRVHIFTPSSTQALIATLAMLPKYARQHGLPPGVLLVLDGLGSNYWADRKEALHVRVRSRRATPFFRLQQLLVDSLHAVHRRLPCLTVATSLLLLPALDSPDSPDALTRVVGPQLEYRDHMIQRWSSVVTRSFVVDSRAENSLTRVTFTPLADRRRASLYMAYIDNSGLHANTGVGSFTAN